MADEHTPPSLEAVVDGSRIDGIASLYAELNRVFMAGEDWRLGASLDALDDLLYGGYGALHASGAVRIVWNDHQHAAAALGRETTEAWLRAKLEQPDRFDTRAIRRQLDELLAGRGQTYWDIVLDVFAGHPHELVLR